MALPYQLHQREKSRHLNQQGTPTTSQFNSSLSIFEGKPFWLWGDKQKHIELFKLSKGACCANHILKCPVKNGKEYPIFDYQKLIFDAIENNQNIWILKSRGIGVTTFMIRYFAWKILYSDELENKSIFIVSGTREEHANYIKEKLEALFENFPVTFESKYTELLLKKTWIKVFPTRNIKDIRGYMDVAYVFCDEIDYLDDSIQDELMHAISPYEEKSNCKIILCSTPYKPLGLMQRIENDSNSKYVKLKLGYQYGIDKIYDRQFIEKMKLEPEFEREMNCKYLGRIGSVFSQKDIDRAVLLGDSYDPTIVSMDSVFSLGLDSGFGSSSFGLVLLEMLEGKIFVKMAEEIPHVRYEDICNRIKSILISLNRWSPNQETLENVHVYVDGSAIEFVRSLKMMVGEDDNPQYWKEQLEQCRKYDMNAADFMTIIPINFGAGGAKDLLVHTKSLLEFEARPLVGIPSKFESLILSLRTAVSDNMGRLDKNQTVSDDILDAAMLALKHFRIKKPQTDNPILLTK